MTDITPDGPSGVAYGVVEHRLAQKTLHLVEQAQRFAGHFPGRPGLDHPGGDTGEQRRADPVDLSGHQLFVLQSVLLVLVLVLAALVMGLRAPPAGVLIGFACVALLTVALGSMSYTVAMKVDKPQEFGPVVNAVPMPSMLLSGLMLPMALAPGRLDVLSHFMPIRHAVDAMRDACVGHYATAHMPYGVLVALAPAALAVTVGTRGFRRAAA
ncbi:ABC transporter permease [Streptomyces sp. NPDC056728]